MAALSSSERRFARLFKEFFELNREGGLAESKFKLVAKL